MDLITFIHHYWKPALEVAIFWYAYYIVIIYIKDTGAVQVVKGLILLAIFLFLSEFFDLKTISLLLTNLFPLSIIGFLIVFQPEIRRGLTRLGESPLFKYFLKEEKLVDEIVRAVISMSKKRIGALIAIEREVGLRPYVESGVHMDAALTYELLTTVFLPSTPFHDGAALIQGGRLSAVGCLLPLSQNPRIPKNFGTRHRAGLGLSEETDAVVIVVSEETGAITLMAQGKMNHGIEEERLRQELRELYQPHRVALAGKRLHRRKHGGDGS